MAAARVAEHAQEFDVARDWHERAYEWYEESSEPDDPALSFAACALAMTLAEQGESRRAQELLDAHLPRLRSWRLALPSDVARATVLRDALAEGRSLR